MPPTPILDPAELDFANLVADAAAVEAVNPHRHEFRLLDGVVLFDPVREVYAGFHDIREDAFWVRGHIPGRPIFPGVLMIEAAAQLASYATHQWLPDIGFLGFAGVDDVKFRGMIEPPARLVMVGRRVDLRRRRVVSDMQGFVGSTMVFECVITGMPM
jgi:3-hydroxyacyl-[acyl-carrier-protein] dehydratase